LKASIDEIGKYLTEQQKSRGDVLVENWNPEPVQCHQRDIPEIQVCAIRMKE